MPLFRNPSAIGIFLKLVTTAAPTTTTAAPTTTTAAPTTTTAAATTTTAAPTTTTSAPATTTTAAATTTTAAATTTTAAATTTTAAATTTTAAPGPGPCENYAFTAPTCNGEDSYVGNYTKTRRQNPAGSGNYEDCTSAIFTGYGSLIEANNISCGGSGNTTSAGTPAPTTTTTTEAGTPAPATTTTTTTAEPTAGVTCTSLDVSIGCCASTGCSTACGSGSACNNPPFNRCYDIFNC